MVKGLDKFKSHFAKYSDQYILIGGTACDIAMESAGVDFRSTKDLDIVLCVEAINDEFVQSFWNFIREGKYQNLQKSTGKRLFYRFYSPADVTFPYMLELFSRTPDTLNYSGEVKLTPIPVSKEVSSLSAILLDDAYYHFINTGKVEEDGLVIIGAEYLIPLKTRAWLDLTGRKNNGEGIDEKNIKKHKNDVFRLLRIITPDKKITIPESIKNDIKRFCQAMNQEKLDPEMLGYKNRTKDNIISELSAYYEIVD